MKVVVNIVVFDLVLDEDITTGRQPLLTKWVWTTKLGIDGEINIFKAR